MPKRRWKVNSPRGRGPRLLTETATSPHAINHNSLPSDVWLLVLAAGSGDESPTTDRPFILAISHVSRSWRHLVLSTPSLWTRIYVPIRPTFQHWPPGFLDLQISRTQGLPLDVKIDGELSPQDHVLYQAWNSYWVQALPDRYDKVLHQLASHAHRLRSLAVHMASEWRVVTLPFSDDALPILDPLRQPAGLIDQWQALDNLVELSLTGRDWVDPTIQWPARASRLRFVQLHHVRVRWEPEALANVEVLDVRGPAYTEDGMIPCMWYDGLAAALGPAPVLRRLSFAGDAIAIRDTDAFSRSGIQLACLHTLYLEDVPRGGVFLERLHAPKLHSLHIDYCRAPGGFAMCLAAIKEVRAAKFAKVEQFRLATELKDASLLAGLVDALPLVHQFALSGSVTANVRRALLAILADAGEQRVALAWPHLETLTLSMDFLDYNVLTAETFIRSTVDRRAAAGTPLTALKLLAGENTRLSEELVSWLSDWVTFEQLSMPKADGG